jgi:hypothetical protein
MMYGEILSVKFLRYLLILLLFLCMYLDAIENVGYFSNIEKILSSIGLSISDAVMAFFNSGGVQNKDVCIDR